MRFKEFLTEAPSWPTTKDQVEARIQKTFFKNTSNASSEIHGHYHINDDLTVSTENSVVLGTWNSSLTYAGKYFPVKFRDVRSISLRNCRNLISLEGFPLHVEDSIRIEGCRKITHLPSMSKTLQNEFVLKDLFALQSLEGCPESVDSSVTLINLPNVRSLKGIPSVCYALRIINVPVTLEGISDFVKDVEYQFNFKTGGPQVKGGIGAISFVKDENASSFEFDLVSGKDRATEKDIEAGDIIFEYLGNKDNIFECQTRLIDMGLEDYAIF